MSHRDGTNRKQAQVEGRRRAKRKSGSSTIEFKLNLKSLVPYAVESELVDDYEREYVTASELKAIYFSWSLVRALRSFFWRNISVATLAMSSEPVKLFVVIEISQDKTVIRKIHYRI